MTLPHKTLESEGTPRQTIFFSGPRATSSVIGGAINQELGQKRETVEAHLLGSGNVFPGPMIRSKNTSANQFSTSEFMQKRRQRLNQQNRSDQSYSPSDMNKSKSSVGYSKNISLAQYFLQKDGSNNGVHQGKDQLVSGFVMSKARKDTGKRSLGPKTRTTFYQA